MRAILQKIINYATKASSCYPAQPWKFRAEGCSLYIYPDYTHNQKEVDGDDHNLFIALGCALENAVVAANAFGYSEHVTYHFTDEHDYVRVSFEPMNTCTNQILFVGINDRSVTLAPMMKQTIEAEQMADLALQARERDVFLKIYDTDEEFAQLLPLVEEAAVLRFRDQDFPDWVRLPDPDLQSPEDKSWGQPVGGHSVRGWMGRLFTNHLASAKAEAKRARELVLDSAALVLFSTSNNTREGWVNLGRSYQRIALKANTLGIRHARFGLPCAEEPIREKLKEDLGYTGEEPLLMMRLGFVEEVAGAGQRTARRTA